MGFFPGPQGRKELRSQHPTTQNQERPLWGPEGRGGESSQTERVREHRGMGKGSAMEKSLVPHGEKAFGVFTPQRQKAE